MKTGREDRKGKGVLLERGIRDKKGKGAKGKGRGIRKEN